MLAALMIGVLGPDWATETNRRVETMAASLERRLKPFAVPHRVFDIRDYGAIADGTTVNTGAISSAIRACAEAGGGVVRISGGDFVTGTIDLRSNVTLEVTKGARLLGSLHLRDYPDRVARTFTVMDSNMGLNQSLIFAERCENVGIRGEGTIDGRGTQKNFPGPTTIGPVTGRPFLIRFLECRNVNIRDITLRDAASWMQNYLACDRVILDGVKVDSRVNGNNDGIDIDGCRDVIVRNCVVQSGDDAMCFKGASGRDTENVLVEDSAFATWCNALKFGTDSQGSFRNVLVRRCRLSGLPGGAATSGITWASVDGGDVEDIVCRDLVIERTGSPFFFRRGSRARTLPGYPKPPVGEVRRLIVERVRGTDNGRRGSMISGIPGFPIRQIWLRDVLYGVRGGAEMADLGVKVPEGESGYPDAGWFGVKAFPAYGMFVRHAEDIVLEGFEAAPAVEDPRPQWVAGPGTRDVQRHSPR